MGYRYHLAKVPKTTYEEYKDLELDEDFNYRDLPGYEVLHELGKYCEFNSNNRFFTNYSSLYEDEDFDIVDAKFLLSIIEEYRIKVQKHYESLETSTHTDLTNYARNMAMEWRINPFNLKLDEKEIVSSWKFEYSVFELVRIYKDFDWENDILIYMGG